MFVCEAARNFGFFLNFRKWRVTAFSSSDYLKFSAVDNETFKSNFFLNIAVKRKMKVKMKEKFYCIIVIESTVLVLQRSPRQGTQADDNNYCYRILRYLCLLINIQRVTDILTYQ